MAILVSRESAHVESYVKDLSAVPANEGASVFAVIVSTKGPLNEVKTIHSAEEFEEVFGIPDTDMVTGCCAYHVAKSGTLQKLVRVATASAAAATVTVPGTTEGSTVTVSAKYKGTYGNNMKVIVSSATENNFTITVIEGTSTVEIANVSNSSTAANYVMTYKFKTINIAQATGDYSPMAASTYTLGNGNDGDTGITAADYKGVLNSDGTATGAYCFLNDSISGTFFASYGVADKTYFKAMKEIAESRKDLTCIYDTPASLTQTTLKNWINNEGSYASDTALADWQDWFCEVYWDWVKVSVNGQVVNMPPSCAVVINGVTSYDEYGPALPVAGAARGVLEVEGLVTQPLTKAIRDDLVTNRINFLYDTGSNGIQIYANETLNRDYTSLSSAHIARTLTFIRSTVDRFTETLKFEVNSPLLWLRWRMYVEEEILAPLANQGALSYYKATMDETTMTAADIANRICRGTVELQFVPDAEVFKLEYFVRATDSVVE